MKSNEKGSVTIIVVVTILFIVIILSSFLVYISSRRRAQVKETEAISKAYDDDMHKVYKDITNEKTIKKPITQITGNETLNIETEDKNGERVVVPAGFKVVNPTDSVNDGIIIEDVSAKDDTSVGNQFVWIPCTIDGANGSLKYDRYAFKSDTWTYSQTKLDEKAEDGSNKIIIDIDTSHYFHETMSQKERDSIQKYEGYYIGRYEAGCNVERDGSDSEADVAQIKSNLNVYNYVTISMAEDISEKMYEGKSMLCSSYAWDTALKFIDGEGGTYSVNSVGDNCESGELKKTGYNAMKNIYDMGGNSWEWTSELSSKENFGYCYRRRSFQIFAS